MNVQKSSKTSGNISAGAWTFAAVLLVCVMLTSSVVGAAMGIFTSRIQPDAVISLLPPEEKIQKSTNVTTLTIKNKRAYAALSASPKSKSSSQPSYIRLADTFSSFYFGSDKQLWGSNTELDVFRASYENGAGVITAGGKNGEKIVAPGTSNTLLFKLTNDGDAAIDYELKITAVLSEPLREYDIPVRARLCDETGEWLKGGADSWVGFTSLSGTVKDAVLGSDSYSAYTLEWEWPYETGNDEFDTMLGDLALEKDLVLSLNIDVIASYDTDPSAPGGNAQTGDSSHMILWICIMILSLVGLIAALSLRKRAKLKYEVSTYGEKQ